MQPIENTGYTALTILSKANRFNRWMYEAIKPHLTDNVLEIGSGIGNISSFILQDFNTVTLSDIDDFYLQKLKTNFQQQSQASEFLSINLQMQSFKIVYKDLKEKFDSLVLLNVLEHLPDDNYALENCKFLLKPKGTLIILVPAYKFLFSRMDKELHHFRRYTAKSLRKKIAAQSFQINKSFYFNFLGIFAWLYGKIFKLKVLPSSEMNVFNRLVPLGRFLDKIVFQRTGLSTIVIAKKISPN